VSFVCLLLSLPLPYISVDMMHNFGWQAASWIWHKRTKRKWSQKNGTSTAT